MNLIADLQNNRDAVSTREYLGLMQESIDEKISLLELLREKYLYCYLEWFSSPTNWKEWRRSTSKTTTEATGEEKISSFLMIYIDLIICFTPFI